MAIGSLLSGKEENAFHVSARQYPVGGGCIMDEVVSMSKHDHDLVTVQHSVLENRYTLLIFYFQYEQKRSRSNSKLEKTTHDLVLVLPSYASGAIHFLLSYPTSSQSSLIISAPFSAII